MSDEITVEFDGSCEPTNPGGVATCGWIVLDVKGVVIASGAREVCRGPQATNNTAEWCALGFALAWLKENAVGSGCAINLKGDSQLVVRQLTGHWKCNKPHLQRFRARCLEILGQIGCKSWTATWIPREANDAADALSRQAYETATGKKYPERARSA